MDAWATSQGLGDRKLNNDPVVTYYRSRYSGLRCVYIVHERIRHIFV